MIIMKYHFIHERMSISISNAFSLLDRKKWIYELHKNGCFDIKGRKRTSSIYRGYLLKNQISKINMKGYLLPSIGPINITQSPR